MKRKIEHFKNIQIIRYSGLKLATKEELNIVEEFGESDDKVEKFLNSVFEDEWGDIKKNIKDISRKEALREMFITGGMFYKEITDKIIVSLFEIMQKNPEDFEKLADEYKEEMKKDNQSK